MAPNEDSQQANNEVSSGNVLDGIEDTSHVPAEQTSPVRLTDNMAAHMEHLFAQAERTLQDSDATIADVLLQEVLVVHCNEKPDGKQRCSGRGKLG